MCSDSALLGRPEIECNEFRSQLTSDHSKFTDVPAQSTNKVGGSESSAHSLSRSHWYHSRFALDCRDDMACAMNGFSRGLME